MARFTEQKLSCQKLEKIKTADGEIAGVFASKLRVSIDGMLPGIQNGGQLSGRVQEYEASFTANDNEIYGVKDLSIGNAANTGTVDKDEYVVGEEHKASVYVDDKMHVTMKVENPGGTTNLFVTYTIFSRKPIEDVSQSENYQVAQDYGQRNDTPNGFVEITDDDDMIEASWRHQTLDACVVKNLATGRLLRDETECKDISNGQKNRNYFIAPRSNIKWVSIESQVNAEANKTPDEDRRPVEIGRKRPTVTRTPKYARDTKSSSMHATRQAQKEKNGTDVKKRGARHTGAKSN